MKAMQVWLERYLTYVLRDMTHEDGGFFSAEDADSEGEEGTFYVWTKDELIEILGKRNGEIMNKVYGLQMLATFMMRQLADHWEKHTISFFTTTKRSNYKT